jgi:hypothetical protein
MKTEKGKAIERNPIIFFLKDAEFDKNIISEKNY